MGSFDPKVDQARRRASAGDLAGALSAVDAALAEARQAGLFRARLLEALHRPRDAWDQLVALDGTDNSPRILEMRLDLEERLGLVPEAITTLARLLQQAKDQVPLLARRALLHQSTGDRAAAKADLETALQQRPLDGELHRLRVGLVRVQDGDGTLATLRDAMAKVQPGSPSEVHLHFARAKALDDQGDTAQASAALVTANAGMRALYPFKINDHLAQEDALRTAFADVTPETVQSPPDLPFAPIFVAGLPRSGTTLVEQILSAHSQVSAGGETGALSAAVAATIGMPKAKPANTLDLSSQRLGQLGAAYAAAMTDRLAPDTGQRITDKSLRSLSFAGPALAALPNAHMVVVRRDPRAVAVSLFRHVFRPGKQLFSYAMEDIHAYQRDFDTTLAFWSARLSDRFHVIDYEALVQDPEGQTRRLLQAVDLPWDDACLRPEANARPVHTLSALQVREPIGTGALEAWRRYEALL